MSAKEIIEEVARKHQISAAEIIGPSRYKHVVKARTEAINAVREAFPEASFPWIGARFNRSHTTIMYVLGRVVKNKNTKRSWERWP